MKKTISYKVIDNKISNNSKEDIKKTDSNKLSNFQDTKPITQQFTKQTTITKVLSSEKIHYNRQKETKDQKQKNPEPVRQKQNKALKQQRTRGVTIGQDFREAIIQSMQTVKQELKLLKKQMGQQTQLRSTAIQKISRYVDQKLQERNTDNLLIEFKGIIDLKYNSLLSLIEKLDSKIEQRSKIDDKKYNGKLNEQNAKLFLSIEEFQQKIDFKNMQYSNNFMLIDQTIQNMKAEIQSSKETLKKLINTKKDDSNQRNITLIMSKLQGYNDMLQQLKIQDNKKNQKLQQLKKQNVNIQKVYKREHESILYDCKKLKQQILKLGENCDRYDNLQIQVKNNEKSFSIMIKDLMNQMKQKLINNDKYFDVVNKQFFQIKQVIYQNNQNIQKIKDKNQKLEIQIQNLQKIQRQIKNQIQNTLEHYQNNIHQQLAKIISQYNSNFQHIQSNNSQIGHMVSQIIKINSVISQKLCSFVSNKIDFTTFKQIISQMNQKMNKIQEVNIQKMNDIQNKQFKFQHQLRMLKQNVESSLVKDPSLLDISDQCKYVLDNNLLRQFQNIQDENYFRSELSGVNNDGKKQQIEQEQKVSNVYGSL